MLAYWVAEDKDVPARVVLLEIPRLLKMKFKFNIFIVLYSWIFIHKFHKY